MGKIQAATVCLALVFGSVTPSYAQSVEFVASAEVSTLLTPDPALPNGRVGGGFELGVAYRSTPWFRFAAVAGWRRTSFQLQQITIAGETFTDSAVGRLRAGLSFRLSVPGERWRPFYEFGTGFDRWSNGMEERSGFDTGGWHVYDAALFSLWFAHSLGLEVNVSRRVSLEARLRSSFTANTPALPSSVIEFDLSLGISVRISQMSEEPGASL